MKLKFVQVSSPVRIGNRPLVYSFHVDNPDYPGIEITFHGNYIGVKHQDHEIGIGVSNVIQFEMLKEPSGSKKSAAGASHKG